MHLTFVLQVFSSIVFIAIPTRAIDEESRTMETITRSHVPSTPCIPCQRIRVEENPLYPISTGKFVRRDDESDDDLVARHIEIMTTMVPIADAANALQNFYNSVLYEALHAWANLEPQLALRMTMGCLELTIVVVLDRSRVPRGIPWAFVRNFAWNMLTMTRMGFLGTYDIYYSTVAGYHLSADFGIDVRLRVLRGI